MRPPYGSQSIQTRGGVVGRNPGFGCALVRETQTIEPLAQRRTTNSSICSVNDFGYSECRAAYQRRLSRVAEGSGPMKPQQPGSNALVLIPAQ
jgi:hypothetical protein